MQYNQKLISKNSNIEQNLDFQNNSYVDKFKNGYKIKIKKENRGKFTKYCNGKVTNKCISRGKNSPNPITRKRAIFAENAKKFKHV